MTYIENQFQPAAQYTKTHVVRYESNPRCHHFSLRRQGTDNLSRTFTTSVQIHGLTSSCFFQDFVPGMLASKIQGSDTRLLSRFLVYPHDLEKLLGVLPRPLSDRYVSDNRLAGKAIPRDLSALKTHSNWLDSEGASIERRLSKGKGLVILLHGAPGVGKTSTAESIAAASGRPLFSITCGDLGLSPKEVESALEEIFRFAQMWNCILLLDECDIFLARRNKTDIVRNGLVSGKYSLMDRGQHSTLTSTVFLRTLEFYTGVLFLTTNRVGVIDDAIKSRLTWTVYYPPLDGLQTERIWEINLRLLRERNSNLDIDEKEIMEYAKSHFQKSRKNNCCWNGRQIQNAFKVASALAEWETYKARTTARNKLDIEVFEHASSAHRPLLRSSHFETIAQGTQTFDYYLREATGRSEADRAYQNTKRADDWSFEEEPYDSQQSNNQYEPRYKTKRYPFDTVQWSKTSTELTLAPPDVSYRKSRRGQKDQTHSNGPRSSFSRAKWPSVSSLNEDNRSSRKLAARRFSDQGYGASSSNEKSAHSLNQMDDWPSDRHHTRGRRFDEHPDGELSQSDIDGDQYQHEGHEDDSESWNC